MVSEIPPAIEGALVRTFRLSQSLLSLTQEERQALLHGDVPRLLSLADRKEMLLDQLTALGDAHKQAAHILSLPPRRAPVFDRELDDAPAQLAEPAPRARLRCLLEGVQVLVAQTRDLVQGNQTLAALALSQASLQQAGLLSEARADLPALFTALMAAREPPDPNSSPPALPTPRPESTLIEAMTALYHQEAAYRAVLKVSRRVLTN